MEVTQYGYVETAVVILCYNGRKLLEELLPIALKNTPQDNNTQIVLVDNASTDDTIPWLQENHPDIPLICFDKNHGFTGGYNKALEVIDAQYYVLLSNDVEVAPGWLAPLIDQMKGDKGVGVCQPKVRSYYQRDEFEYAGASGGLLDSWGMPLCRGRIFTHTEKDKGQYDDTREIFWASGCCLAVNGEAWKNTGGFDLDFFAHMEEIDLCWRMQGSGYKVMVCPGSVVYHMGGQTLNYDSPFKLYLNCRNNLAMLTKNWSSFNLIFKLPLRMIIDWGAAFYFLITKGYPSFRAVVKGQFDFLFRLSHWFRKRAKTKRVPSGQITGLYKGSLIFDYFIKGVRAYPDLSS